MQAVNQTTKNYLQFCYTCPDAHACDSEEKCRKCWLEQGLLSSEEEKEEITTEELLRIYAL